MKLFVLGIILFFSGAIIMVTHAFYGMKLDFFVLAPRMLLGYLLLQTGFFILKYTLSFGLVDTKLGQEESP